MHSSAWQEWHDRNYSKRLILTEHGQEGIRMKECTTHHHISCYFHTLCASCTSLHKPVLLYLGLKGEFSHQCAKSCVTRCTKGTVSQLCIGERPHYALLCPLLPLPPITPNIGYKAMAYFAVVSLTSDKGLSVLQFFLLLSLLGNLNHHHCFIT